MGNSGSGSRRDFEFMAQTERVQEVSVASANGESAAVHVSRLASALARYLAYFSGVSLYRSTSTRIVRSLF